MAKLEVGRWYRQKGEEPGYLYQYKGVHPIAEKDFFYRYKDGKDKQRIMVSERFIDLYKNPLETLTPSEALILLGKGFVLKKKGYLIKKDNDTIITRRDKEVERGFWHLAALSLLQGFKIHALPEGENG